MVERAVLGLRRFILSIWSFRLRKTRSNLVGSQERAAYLIIAYLVIRMFRKLFLLLALLAPTAAAAQSLQGFYIGAAGGPNFAGSPESSDGHVQFNTDVGGLGLASLGWAFDNGFRVELEGSYRSNGISSIDTLRVNGRHEPIGIQQGNTPGLNTWAAMLNGAYDIPLANFGLAWPFQPYIGAGVGFAWLDLANVSGDEPAIIHLPANNTYTGPAAISFGSGSAFAYQAIAGASMPITLVPGLEATLEYRFFGTSRASSSETVTAQTTDLINGAIPSTQITRGFVLNHNSLLLGLRYRF
jgi:OOP family OmpA-OmpF porin